MFKRVLVANRGEIAIRIINALKELGIESVAIYSEADENSLHVGLADYAVCVGAPEPKQSYLNIPQIISAAIVTGCDAIHPGYGFLSENPLFREVTEANGLKFIGPSSETMRIAGDKLLIKNYLKEVGIPTIPGYEESINDINHAKEVVKKLGGYPVLLKARSGGGGRGMRIVRNEEELEKFLTIAKEEAQKAFGDETLYMEKYLENPKHIEVQVVGDLYGNIVALGERECSIQRRYQKLLEEAPVLTLEKREEIQSYAIKAAKALNYSSVGTFEFLMSKEGNFYFMELNTRIQVEHPVTEMITGIDLIRTQILVAAGEKLPFEQRDVKINGHAIEVRINAEDPEKGFIPQAGTITHLHLPGGPGVRVDTHIYAGYTIPPYYDSLLMKLIVHDVNREFAIKRLKRALEQTYIEGVPTTIPFFLKLIEHPVFKMGKHHTKFVEEEFLSR